MKQDSKKYYREDHLRSEETYSHVFIGIKYTKETFYQNEFDYRPTFIRPLKYYLRAMIAISVYHNIVQGAINEGPIYIVCSVLTTFSLFLVLPPLQQNGDSAASAS